MNTCGGCQHWERDRYDDLDEYDFGWAGEESPDDDKIKQLVAENHGRWGRCNKIGHGWGKSELAYTMDASMYASSLKTRNDFGCIEWSQRNDRP